MNGLPAEKDPLRQGHNPITFNLVFEFIRLPSSLSTAPARAGDQVSKSMKSISSIIAVFLLTASVSCCVSLDLSPSLSSTLISSCPPPFPSASLLNAALSVLSASNTSSRPIRLSQAQSYLYNMNGGANRPHPFTLFSAIRLTVVLFTPKTSENTHAHFHACCSNKQAHTF